MFIFFTVLNFIKTCSKLDALAATTSNNVKQCNDMLHVMQLSWSS